MLISVDAQKAFDMIELAIPVYKAGCLWDSNRCLWIG